jgi:hypothetical protein
MEKITMWKINISILFCLLPSIIMAQTCDSSIIPTTPSTNFDAHENGTVTDIKTGLMWKKCSEGLTGNNCENETTATSFTWQEALQVPETINSSGGFATYNDWRLPNIKELSSIVEEQCYSPAINLDIFPAELISYPWSSSPLANEEYFSPIFIWTIEFQNNGALVRVARSYRSRVMLVRSGH